MGEDKTLLSNVRECPMFLTNIAPVNTVLRKLLNTKEILNLRKIRNTKLQVLVTLSFLKTSDVSKKQQFLSHRLFSS